MASRAGPPSPVKPPRATAARMARNDRRRAESGAGAKAADDEILANLIESSDVATVFLDAELRIKRFTTNAAHPFNLRQADLGRPIGQITTNLSANHLEDDCRAILDGVASLEREASAADGGHYLLRLFPYRQGSDRRITW